MKFRIAFAATAALALAACGSAEDASSEAQADTVEITADEAMMGIEEAPVADPGANTVLPAGEATDAAPTVTEEAQIEEAGDNAAATAEAAADAMAEETGN